MRKYQNFALLLCSLLIGLHSFAQQPLNQINILSFSVKNKLPAEVASWGTIPGGMILTAQRIPQTSIQGIRLVVQIKQAGAKICGNLIDASPLLDFNAVKTFTAAELNGYISNCNSLKPGNYNICVQFFNVDRYPISKEVCKEFMVEDVVQAQQNYSPPQNISPVNEKQFKEAEVKGTVTFRWTPVLPKPKGQVTYRLKVWQLMQGQTGAAAMRTNQPIVTKDVDNITQAVVTNIYTGPCKPPYLCDYIWNVEAIGKEETQGRPKNYGTSDPSTFKIIVDESNPGSCLKLDTLKYSITCVGQDQDGKFRYKVQNLFINKVVGNTDLFMESGTTGSNINYVMPILPAGVLIQNITPLSFTGITAAVSPAISFEFVSATALTSFTANLAAYTYHLSAAGSKIYCQKNFEMTFDVPSCRCNLCDTSIAKWEIQSEIKYDSTATNNILTLHNDVSFGPYKVVKLSTEIVDFYWYTEGDCKKCNTNDYYFGNLVSGNISGNNFTNAGTSVAGPGGTPIPSSHQIDFIANSLAGTPLSNDVYLNISLPPQTQLSCCTDCFRFCIRYTVTFMQNGVCKTCSIVKCYESKRKHRKVTFQQQINQCGEKLVIMGDVDTQLKK